MQHEVQAANERAAQAQMQAELARKDVEHQREMQKEQQRNQQRAQAVATNEMRSVTVTIPQGVYGGSAFSISYEGQTFRVTCPQGMGPGDRLTVQVPAPQPAVAVAEAAPPVAAPVTAQMAAPVNRGSGRDLFRSAMVESFPPAAAAAVSGDSSSPESVELVLTSDHFVDEAQMKQFGIISVAKGTRVTLLEGDLVGGLGGAYKDYIRVSVPSQGGRDGLISRLIVKMAPSAAGPPPAAFAPPPPPPALHAP
ncbi:Hypothetical Protein FCC1311_024862 [Hondaea fermentalgiana]|uniref:Uncharacterized protein n=1 Tax=Hondaea fermentalgiana TaxID=2315210 RepID=A0A2R5G6W3_9STRA|nr:Hypothetical Protein FCC1311_024862 [Hondaea fermentalgiana]|eukprot:GBG26265.1 Hypothetical Protein FCC1311_024862 [Hondaea fermentalgiana]